MSCLSIPLCSNLEVNMYPQNVNMMGANTGNANGVLAQRALTAMNREEANNRRLNGTLGTAVFRRNGDDGEPVAAAGLGVQRRNKRAAVPQSPHVLYVQPGGGIPCECAAANGTVLLN
jgi:hypothetical protein